jgi:uncharacterized protein involved in response to NO
MQQGDPIASQPWVEVSASNIRAAFSTTHFLRACLLRTIKNHNIERAIMRSIAAPALRSVASIALYLTTYAAMLLSRVASTPA